ncbi:uncharacterized protein LOC108606876 [Drosophila busckii]|uniref:uncharacterized protein LOC108606876 n=1 Tax=Drosophila busckii TaxID=30019 RepID=UPI00083F4942|nr:uncharacterized protein LOC108606876 [Drosophila busckii]
MFYNTTSLTADIETFVYVYCKTLISTLVELCSMDVDIEWHPMTRLEILEQLEKRALFIPNAPRLPLEQLEQIYRDFLVPQPRRERRRIQATDADPPLQRPLPSCSIEQLMKRIQVVSMAGDKRSAEVSQQLQAKRMKLDEQR